MDTSKCLDWSPRDGPFPSLPFNASTCWASATGWEVCMGHRPDAHHRKVELLFNWFSGRVVDPREEPERAREILHHIGKVLDFKLPGDTQHRVARPAEDQDAA